MSQPNQSKRILSLLLLLFNLFHFSLVQGQWSQKANLVGNARARGLSFSIGTKGYIGTGNNGTDMNDFWEYDQQTDTWTQKANLSNVGRIGGIGFSIGNKGYAGLGSSYLQPINDFWEYNPQFNVWSQKTSYPGLGKINAVGFSIDGFGYVGTGSSSNTIGNETKDFWQYNPVNNTWTQKADFGGNQRDRAVAFSISSKGYIGTGYHFNGSPIAYGDFWEYNPITDTWTQKATDPDLPRSNATGFATSSYGYIGMGYPSKTDFWQYNPVTDSWLQMNDFPGPGRTFTTGLSIGNKGYFGMGYSVPGPTTVYYNDFWEFDEQFLGLNELLSPDTFQIYPNPTSDFINLSSKETITEIKVYNLEGKEQLKTNTTPINISNLTPGEYFLKIKSSNGVTIKKVIKI